jgi:hypothetical protein
VGTALLALTRFIVMPGLDPGIHLVLVVGGRQVSIAGSKPGNDDKGRGSPRFLAP